MKRQMCKWGLIVSIFVLVVPVLGADRKVPSQYSTIQAGINAASDGDTVLVADGTYTGDGNRDIDFKGKTITVKSENGAATCIIDCQGAEYNEHRGFYFHSAETSQSILDGFTIQNGREWNYDCGGGILCESSPTIKNCIIQSCKSDPVGGGIRCRNQSSAIISHCTIQNNTSGIGLHGSSVQIDSCTISQNKWIGVSIDSSEELTDHTTTLTNCLITKNEGNGISCQGEDETLLLEKCLISENDSGTNSGGGIYLEDFLSAEIKECIIKNNNVSYLDHGSIGGGGIAAYITGIISPDCGKLSIISCTISDNTVQAYPYDNSYINIGGGLDLEDLRSVSVINCIIEGNSAQEGAGIWETSTSKICVSNCIIKGNRNISNSGSGLCVRGGGDILNSIFIDNNKRAISHQYSQDIANDDLSIKNCLFYENSDGDYYDDASSQTYTGAKALNSLAGCQNNLDGDPLFVTGRYGDYYLSQKSAGQSVDSSCVNAGSDTAINLGLDQMFTRTDGGLDTGMVDIGYHYSISSAAENYKLTTTVNGGHGIISPASGYFATSSTVLLSATPDTHYFVNSWNGTDNDSSTSTSNSVTMLMDRSITVEFEFGYAIKTLFDGKGSITTSSSRSHYTPGEQVTLEAVPQSGWMFDHWTGDLVGSTNPVELTVIRDMTVKAIFSKRAALSIIKIGQGTVTSDPTGLLCAINAQVTMTAKPAEGWSFRKWSGELDSSTNPITITMDKDKTIQAEFVSGTSKEYSCLLTVFVAGKGTVTPSSGVFDKGSTVTLKATPADGWTFAYWAGDVSKIITTPALDVTMDKAHGYTAVFTQKISANTDDSSTNDNSQNDTNDDGGNSNNNSTTDNSTSNDSSNNDFNINDLLSSCSIPTSVILLALFTGFINLKFGSRE